MFKKVYRDYSDVLILPKPTKIASRSHVELEDMYTGIGTIPFDTIPIIASNMDTVGTFEMAVVLGNNNIMTALHKHYSLAELVHGFKSYSISRDLTFVTIGVQGADIDKLRKFAALIDEDRPSICIDIANGYIPDLAYQIKTVRKLFPQSWIMAGNVTTKAGVKLLAKAGANIIKIGIGGGAQCRTRVTAGVGMPMISAIEECRKEAKRHKVYICADGGIQEYADFAKAYVAGADFVMVGSMLAAHNESGGEIVYDKDDQPLKPIYGMSSETAMNKYSGGVASYRASEGRSSLVPLRGPIQNTVFEILGSIRSACTYTNSQTIRDLRKAKLITVRETINRRYEQHTVGK